MSKLNLDLITAYLTSYTDFKAPYDMVPGEAPDDKSNHWFTELEWEQYQYNPPQYFQGDDRFPELQGADPNASLKPTWKQLVEADKEGDIKYHKDNAYRFCEVQTTLRIGKLYHSEAEEYPNKEYQVRLSNADTAEADEKRLEYIRICHVFEGRIERATTVKQLEKIMNDIRSDTSWPK